MSLWIKPSDFTKVKKCALFDLRSCEHRIGMRLPDHLRQHRREELKLLKELRVESTMPEWYPHQ